jgi:hypothetical protein
MPRSAAQRRGMQRGAVKKMGMPERGAVRRMGMPERALRKMDIPKGGVV